MVKITENSSTIDDSTKKTTKAVPLSTFALMRLFSKVYIGVDKWLLSNEKLQNRPSLLDGLDEDDEKQLRYLGCELIQAGAILLKLPQVAAATAQILYQRYFYQKSFVRIDFEHTVMACLLLASKIEEAPRRPRDVINVFHRMKQYYRQRNHVDKKATALILDQNYILLKNHVIKAERKVLNVLGFVVHIKHPHKLIYAYIHALKCSENTQLMQRAWCYMNDGLKTDIFLGYPSETIACTCIFLAARTIQPPIPLPKTPLDWFELFDASDRDVNNIALILMQLYSRTKSPNWTKLSLKIAELKEKAPTLTGNKSLRFGHISDEDNKKDRKSEKTHSSENLKNEDIKYLNGKMGENRNESRSRNSFGNKSIPKRYKSPMKEKSEICCDKDRDRSRNVKRREKSPSFRREKSEKDSFKDKRKRSLSRDAVIKMDRKAREKEVIQTLSRRKRDSSSPEQKRRRKR